MPVGWNPRGWNWPGATSARRRGHLGAGRHGGDEVDARRVTALRRRQGGGDHRGAHVHHALVVGVVELDGFGQRPVHEGGGGHAGGKRIADDMGLGRTAEAATAAEDGLTDVEAPANQDEPEDVEDPLLGELDHVRRQGRSGSGRRPSPTWSG